MQHKKLILYIWLLSGIIGTLTLVVIGGITRLTDSGLSITEWNVIMGVVPPLSEHEWEKAYFDYQQFPQFKLTNTATDLTEFKAIFFWEYLHRLLGRILALGYFIPFVGFWIKKWLTKDQLFAFLWILFIGALQGFMGWFMVQSGLIDQPSVSHFRLATHLGLAFLFIGYMLWLLQTLKYPDLKNSDNTSKKLLIGFSFLVFIQVVWGAFVAGLDAGLIHNTYPKMNGVWMPPWEGTIGEFIFVFKSGVQWTHRTIAHLLLAFSLILFVRFQRQEASKFLKNPMLFPFIGILIQVGIGISVLLLRVPISLAVIHQFVALLIWMSCLNSIHKMYYNHSEPAFRLFKPRNLISKL